MFNYVLPMSTKWANSELTRIYHESNASSRDRIITNPSVFADSTCCLTYGYLGWFVQGLLNIHSPFYRTIIRNTYILDHAYMPSFLKGSVFRLASANKYLSPVYFSNSSLLSPSDVDSCYQNLHHIQSNSSLSLSFSPSVSSAIGKKPFPLFIKPASVLSKILSSPINSFTSSWFSLFPSLASSVDKPQSKRLVCFKDKEVCLAPSLRIKSRHHNAIKASISYSSISFVGCPASMLAIPFILHGIPTYLSHAHPLSGILGTYVPSMGKRQSLELIMDAISLTSVSISSYPSLENFLLKRLF